MKLLGKVVFLGMVTACGCGRPLVGEPPTSTTDATTTPTTPPVDTQEVQQSLLARWNAVSGAPVDGFDFRWNTFNQFPHPTFKGGTAEAYQAFAKVLLAFFDAGDNFDFLSRNHLFRLHLIYVFPSGQTGLDTNFEDLAVYLTNTDGFPNVP